MNYLRERDTVAPTVERRMQRVDRDRSEAPVTVDERGNVVGRFDARRTHRSRRRTDRPRPSAYPTAPTTAPAALTAASTTENDRHGIGACANSTPRPNPVAVTAPTATATASRFDPFARATKAASTA